MSGKTTASGQTAAETKTTDTPDNATAQVEVSDSGVDTSQMTAQQKAVLDFEPVEMTRGEGDKARTVTARTQAQLVSLKFDGYVPAKKA